MKRSRRRGEREVKRDLKPTGTSYSSEGAMTEIGIYLKIEKHEDTTSHFELKRADSGGQRGRGSAKKEESGSKSGGVEGGWVSRRLVVIQV